jgi:hypothetical protein
MTSEQKIRTAIELVAGRLNLDAASLEGYPIEEIPGGFYVFERKRGGLAAVVAGDAWLVAASGIPRDRHVDAFLAGQRTPPN